MKGLRGEEQQLDEIDQETFHPSTGRCVALTCGVLGAGALTPVPSFQRDHADLVRLTWTISAQINTRGLSPPARPIGPVQP